MNDPVARGRPLDGRDRSDAVIVRHSPVSSEVRRHRFEPRSDGRWTSFEEEWTGDTWRTVGSETVEELAVENAPE